MMSRYWVTYSKVVCFFLLFLLGTTSYGSTITIGQMSVSATLELSIDLPQRFLDLGYSNWSAYHHQENGNFDDISLYDEHSYGRLPGEDESTWMYGRVETQSFFGETRPRWAASINLHENFEPDPGIYNASGEVTFDMEFQVTGGDSVLEVIGWGSGGSASFLLTDLGTLETFTTTIDTFTLLDGHTYSLQGTATASGSGQFGEALADMELGFRSGDTVSVPEPMTLTLMGIGLAGLGWRRRILH